MLSYENMARAGTLEALPTDFLDSIPVYYTYGPNIRRLDMARQLIDSFNYSPYVLAYPFGATSALVFGGLATKEGSLQVPVGSYLWGISAFSSTAATGATPVETGPGFRFSITDKGSGLGIAERSFIFYKNVSGLSPSGYAQAYLQPIGNLPSRGPYLLDAPFVITQPGQVQVSITNLATVANTIQVAFHFAYPINDVSVNTPHIRST